MTIIIIGLTSIYSAASLERDSNHDRETREKFCLMIRIKDTDKTGAFACSKSSMSVDTLVVMISRYFNLVPTSFNIICPDGYVDNEGNIRLEPDSSHVIPTFLVQLKHDGN
jgi:hypothetical protein